MHRIFSNNSRGRLLFFSHKKGAIIRWKAIISNNLLLTGTHALYFCFIIPLKQEKWSHMGFLRLPNLVPWLIFNVKILSIRAWIVTDQFCWIRLYLITWQGGGKRKRRRQEGWGWGASIQGEQIIEERLFRKYGIHHHGILG